MSLMLDDDDLDWMREAVGELLPGTCNILLGTVSVNGQGGQTVTWGTVTAGVACRLDVDRRGNQEALAGEARLPFSFFILTLPAGTALSEQQRVEFVGKTFNVETVDGDKSWAACVRARVAKVA